MGESLRTHLRLCRRHINRQSGFHTCVIESIGERSRPATVRVLSVVIAIETLAALAVVVVLVLEVITAPAASFGGALALTALALAATVWLAAILRGIWRGRAWSRAAAIVWQVLQIAIGVGALQGAVAQPAWGWPLIIVAVTGFLLLLGKPVAGWLSSRD